jgi:hypothetical protein
MGNTRLFGAWKIAVSALCAVMLARQPDIVLVMADDMGWGGPWNRERHTGKINVAEFIPTGMEDALAWSIHRLGFGAGFSARRIC